MGIINRLKRFWTKLRKSRVARFAWRNRLTRFALLGLLLFYIVAFVGPAVAPHDPLKYNPEEIFASPSLEHPFGADSLGRDVFTRVLYAMRTTAIISLLILLFGGWPFNVILGPIAAYYGGKVDSLIVRIGEVIGSVPPLIFLIIVILVFRDSFESFALGILGPLGMLWLVESGITSIFLVMIALSLIGWVGGVFVLRSRVLQEREQGYVESLKVLGASDRRIIFGHILPNVMGLVVLSLSSILLAAVSSEVGLSFLGLGIQDPYPSFGIMLHNCMDFAFLRNHIHFLIIPCVLLWYIGMLSWVLGDQLGRIIESKKSYV